MERHSFRGSEFKARSLHISLSALAGDTVKEWGVQLCVCTELCQMSTEIKTTAIK